MLFGNTNLVSFIKHKTLTYSYLPEKMVFRCGLAFYVHYIEFFTFFLINKPPLKVKFLGAVKQPEYISVTTE